MSLNLSADTARLAATPSPWGSPSGPGLWKHKGWKLPDYVEQVSKGIMKSGRARSESEAIHLALGVLARWARGEGNVKPEVRAAAAKAIAEFQALRAATHSHSNTGQRAIELVGPKGYIHGWIHVGPQAAGAKVFHSGYGYGTVTGHEGTSVHVKFSDGTERRFESKARSGPGRFEKRTTAARSATPKAARAAAPKVSAASQDYPKMTDRQAEKWGNDGWPSSSPPLSRDQYDALRNYSGAEYTDVNRYLRTGQAKNAASLKKTIATLDRALADHPTPSKATVVHRGLDLDAFGGTSPDKLIGQTIHERGFLSTSVGKEVADGFWHHEAHLEIRVPAGTPAFYMDGLTGAKGERELLLARGLQYKILSARMGPGGKWQILAEIVPVNAATHAHSNTGEAVNLAGAFSEALHPRTAAGNTGGGRFAAKNATATPSPQKAASGKRAQGRPRSPAQQQAAQLRARARDLRGQARVLDVHAAGLAKAHPGAIAAAAKATKTARTKAARKKNVPVKHHVKHAAKAKPSAATQISTLRTRASVLRARASVLDLRARSIVSLAGDTPAVELAAQRVPAGKRDGGQFSGGPVTFGAHDTPARTAAVVNALGRDQRAACRRTILEPPGFSWRDGDLLREASA